MSMIWPSAVTILTGGTLKLHLENLREKYPEEVEEILRSLYVDDIITSCSSTVEAQNLKDTVTSTSFRRGKVHAS